MGRGCPDKLFVMEPSADERRHGEPVYRVPWELCWARESASVGLGVDDADTV